MHGLIFAEAQKYVETKVGSGTWDKLLQGSGLDARMYLSLRAYPDAELVSILGTASAATGLPVAAILEDFGAFIVPDLVAAYRALIKAEWRALDFIENTEETIHNVVRLKQPGAKPPILTCTRPSLDNVVLTYDSPRKLCALAKGMIKGIAAHYNEDLRVTELQCMHRGDTACVLSIKSAA